MYSSTQILLILINGAVGGALSVLLAHFARRYQKLVLALILVAAAVFYVAFAARGGAGTTWIVAELAGVAVYGSLGIAGIRRSWWWMALAWALHPVWDLPLHYFGPGHAFAPADYAIACLSWDWVVAGYALRQAMRARWPRPADPTAQPA